MQHDNGHSKYMIQLCPHSLHLDLLQEYPSYLLSFRTFNIESNPSISSSCLLLSFFIINIL
ncbi:unnamed protein product [Amoebophrya sp. A25]|nr:unnamed protein product [Amoebophrya sp. A25]|eukprot:GSA25T00018453001.1